MQLSQICTLEIIWKLWACCLAGFVAHIDADNILFCCFDCLSINLYAHHSETPAEILMEYDMKINIRNSRIGTLYECFLYHKGESFLREK